MKIKKYDAIVVGSGETGGIAAKELAERGLETLVLEAGPSLDEKLFQKPPQPMSGIGSVTRIKAAFKGQHIQARASFFAPEKSFLFVNDWMHPYKSSDDFFLFLRGKQVGGRFLSWGRVALRMSDYAFRSYSLEGVGFDWPIDYEELSPYYEHVENFLGLIGRDEGIPFVPDGKYMAEAGHSKLELEFKKKIEARWPDRKSIAWRYVQKSATPEGPDNKRTTSPLEAARITGRMEIRSNAVVAKINTDPISGKATGVTYIDTIKKERFEVKANVMVICASTIEFWGVVENVVHIFRSMRHEIDRFLSENYGVSD